MQPPNSRHYMGITCFATLVVALALGVAQTRPVSPARVAAPTPTGIKMFHPGNFPPPHPLDASTGDRISQMLAAEAQRPLDFGFGPNAPQIRLSIAHLVEPNKAGLRFVAPGYVGDGWAMAWPKTPTQPETYICLDLYAEANRTYFMDMTFESAAPQVQWTVYGPDGTAEMSLPAGPKKLQHLTFGFVNGPQPGKLLFTISPNVQSSMYRMDIYVK